MEAPRIVVVKWGDAWVEAGAKKLSKLKPKSYTTYTVGFLVKDTKEGVWLSVEYWPDEPDHASYASFIPRGCIQAIVNLTPPYGKRLP